MNQSPAHPGLRQGRALHLLKHSLHLLVLLPVIAGFIAYRIWFVQSADITNGGADIVTTTISQQMLEDRFGVTVKLIGVTAAGGMVDFRFKVLNKEKAEFLVGGAVDIKLLHVSSGVELPASQEHAAHRDELIDGSIYYHFYPNVQNIVKPGDLIAVLFGSIRLEAIEAQ